MNPIGEVAIRHHVSATIECRRVSARTRAGVPVLHSRLVVCFQNRTPLVPVGAVRGVMELARLEPVSPLTLIQPRRRSWARPRGGRPRMVDRGRTLDGRVGAQIPAQDRGDEAHPPGMSAPEVDCHSKALVLGEETLVGRERLPPDLDLQRWAGSDVLDPVGVLTPARADDCLMGF